jgi:hypothetical protein
MLLLGGGVEESRGIVVVVGHKGTGRGSHLGKCDYVTVLQQKCLVVVDPSIVVGTVADVVAAVLVDTGLRCLDGAHM